MLAERFAALAADGEIRAADPGLAARHFTALTIGLALDAIEDRRDEPEILAIIDDGAEAFLRAYR
jgi:TetR/AcrR family transcriptional repressor of mexJK operon